MKITINHAGVRHFRLGANSQSLTIPKNVPTYIAEQIVERYPSGSHSRRQRIVDELKDYAAAEVEANECLDEWERGEYD